MQRKFQPPLRVALSALFLFLVLIGLGIWQLKRMEWKAVLLAQIEHQMQKPAVPLPEKLNNPAEWEYRRVTLAGRFLHDHELLVKPRTLDGASGYHVVVPFQRASGGIVMVNRGWISDSLMPKASRPAGTLQIEGVVRQASATYFTPPNDPQKNDWYWADVNAMAASAKLKNPAPVLVTIANKEPGVYPAGGRVEVNIHNNHLQYAIFWFIMAVVLQGVFIIRYWKPLPT